MSNLKLLLNKNAFKSITTRRQILISGHFQNCMEVVAMRPPLDNICNSSYLYWKTPLNVFSGWIGSTAPIRQAGSGPKAIRLTPLRPNDNSEQDWGGVPGLFENILNKYSTMRGEDIWQKHAKNSCAIIAFLQISDMSRIWAQPAGDVCDNWFIHSPAEDTSVFGFCDKDDIWEITPHAYKTFHDKGEKKCLGFGVMYSCIIALNLANIPLKWLQTFAGKNTCSKWKIWTLQCPQITSTKNPNER